MLSVCVSDLGSGWAASAGTVLGAARGRHVDIVCRFDGDGDGAAAPCTREVNGVILDISSKSAYLKPSQKGTPMPEFMDVHSGMIGITSEALAQAHHADLAIQEEEGVTFQRAWADPTSGVVFCLSDAPTAEAVQRIHHRAGHPADAVYKVTLNA